jgi:hypothetical protein
LKIRHFAGVKQNSNETSNDMLMTKMKLTNEEHVNSEETNTLADINDDILTQKENNNQMLVTSQYVVVLLDVHTTWTVHNSDECRSCSVQFLCDVRHSLKPGRCREEQNSMICHPIHVLFHGNHTYLIGISFHTA